MVTGERSLNDEIRALDASVDDERARDPLAARKKAMDLLARREHTADELARKLVRSGFEETTATDAIATLTQEGLQSDERFVEAFVASRVRQGKGPERIRQDLRQRGAASASVSMALARAGVDWFALARSVRQRKFGASEPADYKEKARQMRFLQYRGFEQEHIRAALSAADDDPGFD